MTLFFVNIVLLLKIHSRSHRCDVQRECALQAISINRSAQKNVLLWIQQCEGNLSELIARRQRGHASPRHSPLLCVCVLYLRCWHLDITRPLSMMEACAARTSAASPRPR